MLRFEQIGDSPAHREVIGQAAMRFLDIVDGRAGELREGKRDGAVAFEGFVVSELIALHPQPDDGLLIHTRDEHKSLIRLGQGLLNG